MKRVAMVFFLLLFSSCLIPLREKPSPIDDVRLDKKVGLLPAQPETVGEDAEQPLEELAEVEAALAERELQRFITEDEIAEEDAEA